MNMMQTFTLDVTNLPNFSTTCEGPSAREENLGRLSPDLQGLTRSLSESPGLHRSEVITHVDH